MSINDKYKDKQYNINTAYTLLSYLEYSLISYLH
jgi:hypothetical protein